MRDFFFTTLSDDKRDSGQIGPSLFFVLSCLGIPLLCQELFVDVGIELLAVDISNGHFYVVA